ncbi:MAG: Carnitine transport binding protein OpuCC [Chlamydiae bacterium]|nr:Carnitine transport binding protein OpuCC [Chlamydiota bacterium]
MKELKKQLWLIGLSFCACLIFLILILNPFSTRGDHTITIGAKNCTEQIILAEIFATLIEERTEIEVVRRHLEGTSICFQSLLSGDVDLYFEYTGTALLNILKETTFPGDLYSYLKERFSDKYGLIWLDRLGFSNHYGLVVRAETPYRTITDIAKDPRLRLAFDPEFTARSEFNLIKGSYPIPEEWKPKLMDQVLLYFSLLNESVDVISGETTHGRLVDSSCVFLEDNCNALPKYEVAALTSKTCLEKFPEIISLSKLLSGKITEKKMRNLNHAVEFEGVEVKDLARDFLIEQGLL